MYTSYNKNEKAITFAISTNQFLNKIWRPTAVHVVAQRELPTQNPRTQWEHVISVTINILFLAKLI